MTITQRVHSSSSVSLSHWWASSSTRRKSAGAAVHREKANELEDERQTQRRIRKDQGKKGTVCKKPYIYKTIRYGRKTSVRQFVVSEQAERDGERGKRRNRRVHLIRYYMPAKKGGGDWGKTSAQPHSLIIHSTTFTPFLKINGPHADLGWALTHGELWWAQDFTARSNSRREVLSIY